MVISQKMALVMQSCIANFFNRCYQFNWSQLYISCYMTRLKKYLCLKTKYVGVETYMTKKQIHVPLHHKLLLKLHNINNNEQREEPFKKT